MNTYLLGLGSNISPQRNLKQAVSMLIEVGDVLSVSPSLITAPVGNTFSEDFGNQLVVLATQLPPTMLKHQLLSIELEMGREPKSPARKTKDRTIDIDILQQLPAHMPCEYGQSSDWAKVDWDIFDSYYLEVLQHWRQQHAA